MKTSTVVLTRFNLALPFGRSGGRDLGVLPGKTNLDPVWLENRVNLFKDYCSPSMTPQLSDIHAWFIMFDPDTPPGVVETVCHTSGIEPIFASSQGQAVKKMLARMDASNYILSVRLDSDDMLSNSFFSSTNALLPSLSQLARENPLAISYPNGSEYDTETGQFYERFYPGNSFVALLEKPGSPGNFSGVFKTAHFAMQRQFRFLTIPTDDPMWCINVHGGNVANEIKGKASKTSFREDFSLR